MIKKLITKLNIFLAIRKADKHHKSTGEQCFVIAYLDNKGKIVHDVMTKERRKQYNKIATKAGKPKLSHLDILKMSVYKTSL